MSHDRSSLPPADASAAFAGSLGESGDSLCLAALDTVLGAIDGDAVNFADAGLAAKTVADAMVEATACLFPELDGTTPAA